MTTNPNDEAILEIQSQVDRSFGQHSPRQMQSEMLYQILSGMMEQAVAEKNSEKLQALLNFMSYIPSDCSKRLYERLIMTDGFRVPALVESRNDFAARAKEICRLFDVACIKQLSGVLTLLKKNADHQEVWDFPDTFDFDENEGGED